MGSSILKINENDYQNSLQTCKFFILGRLTMFPGSSPPSSSSLQKVLQSFLHIQQIWNFSPLGNSFFVMHFTSYEDKVKVLSLSSIKLHCGIFRMYNWILDFQPSKKFSITHTWIQIHMLPLEYWCPKILASIASVIGPVICISKNTIDKKFGVFAKILVEIDTSKTYPASILVERQGFNFEVHIKYENVQSLDYQKSRKQNSGNEEEYSSDIIRKNIAQSSTSNQICSTNSIQFEQISSTNHASDLVTSEIFSQIVDKSTNRSEESHVIDASLHEEMEKIVVRGNSASSQIFLQKQFSDSHFYDKKHPVPILRTTTDNKNRVKMKTSDSFTDDSVEVLKILTEPHIFRQKKMMKKTCKTDSRSDKPDLNKKFEDALPLMKQRRFWMKKFQEKSKRFRSLYLKKKIAKKKKSNKEVDFSLYIVELMADDYRRRLLIQSPSPSAANLQRNMKSDFKGGAGDHSDCRRRSTPSSPTVAALSNQMTSSSALPVIVDVLHRDVDVVVIRGTVLSNTRIPDMNTAGSINLFSKISKAKSGPDPIPTTRMKSRSQDRPLLGQGPFLLKKKDFPPLSVEKFSGNNGQKFSLNPAGLPFQKSGFSDFCDDRPPPPDPTISYPEGFTYPWPDTADDDFSESHDSYYDPYEEDDFIAF